MLNSKVYEEAIINGAEAVCFAEPVFAESADSGQISDFRIIFANDALTGFVGDGVHEGALFSSLADLLDDDHWIEVPLQVYGGTLRYVQKEYFVKRLSMWISVVFTRLPSNLLCISVQDVSEIHRREEDIIDQNNRLAELSDKLNAARMELNARLESIKALNESLEHLAFYDKLTSLPNREKLAHDLHENCLNCAGTEKQICILLMDIDNFKNVNDVRGRETGDGILCHVASVLSGFRSETVEAYRFGGDEFVVTVSDADAAEKMDALSDSIMERLAESHIHVSCGIATFPDDSNYIERVLSYADITMYHVKRNGRNSKMVFRHKMQETFYQRVLMESQLEAAVRDKSFMLFYQPQVDIAKKKLRGFEALLRWNSPDFGWVSPELFIPLAEETRIIIPLGEWIMETACRTLAKWRRDYGFDGIMSINMSPIQLTQDDFIPRLEEIIRENGLPPESVEVEVTEGIAITNLDETVRLLDRIKKIGVGISLDDFGTGYSSLSYLPKLPLSTLKIDKSFVRNIAQDQSAESNITEAIVSMVSKLGIDTIAEGVENTDQLEVLEKLHCKNLQGYLTGKPMPEDVCCRMLGGDKSAIDKLGDETVDYQI